MTAPHPIHLIRPDAPALAAQGAYPVGVRTGHFDIAAMTGQNPRRLTVEIWYPAAAGTPPGTIYDTLLRDGVTPLRYAGLAHRNAPVATGLAAPLIVLSHGHPGNRYLMSHLAESLAAKGYVVAAPDHPGSIYKDQQAFGQTLLHRPHDQARLIDVMADLSGDLGGLCDTSRVGVIGYSMGGYGALVLGGAGLAATALDHDSAPPGAALAVHLAGSDGHAGLHDTRIKAILPIGPWGNAAGMWDAEGLAGLRVPMLLMAGTQDDTSGYTAMRGIFEQSQSVERHLLSFANAGHNAAAPVPAPPESWVFSDTLGRASFDHYADPVWDTLRMNNIAQHFAAAFMGLHLKQDASMAPYLTPGTLLGFAQGTTAGLALEQRGVGQ